MAERETTDLEDSRSWHSDSPEKSGLVRNRRTVVSVSFPSGDFQVVAAAAHEAGLSTSQFIREAAMAKASPAHPEAGISWAGGTASVVIHIPLRRTTLVANTREPKVEYTAKGADVYTST